MSITDELRHEVANYPFRDNRDFALFEAIADRIDAEHEEALGSKVARAIAAGEDGTEFVFLPEKELSECYMELPKDADGEPIHIGDVMDGIDKYNSLIEVTGKVITVSFEADGLVDVAVLARNDDGKSWRRAYLDPDASVYRHHHERTVEDVLEELLREYDRDDSELTNGEIIERFAARLLLAGDGE